jgi:hypothetical protein
MSLYGKRKNRSFEVWRFHIDHCRWRLQPHFTKRTHSFLLPPGIRVGTICQIGVTERYHDSRRHQGPRPKWGKRIRISSSLVVTRLQQRHLASSLFFNFCLKVEIRFEIRCHFRPQNIFQNTTTLSILSSPLFKREASSLLVYNKDTLRPRYSF